MSKIKITTVQNVDVEYNIANVGERISAFLLDGLIIFVYSIIVYFAAFSVIGFFDSYNETLITVLFIFAFTPIFFYHLILELLFNGQSFGKMAMKIKVIRLDGESPTIGNYLLRWLLRLVDITISQGGIALLAILLNEKGQRLGDLAAGTTVVQLKQTTTLKDTVYSKLEQPTLSGTEEEAYQVMYPQVSRFSDEDIASIREITNTAHRTGNLEALAKLFEKLKETLAVEPEGTSIEFIKQLIKDYNYLNNEGA